MRRSRSACRRPAASRWRRRAAVSGLAVLNLAATRQIGLSTFVSLGNKADISGNDILQYAEHDPATSVVLLYLESFGNPRRFGQLARRVSRTKPIVVVKSGRTAAGLRAAASHTAGLAASELAVDGLFQQAGVIRADTIDEMFDVAACLDSQPLPPGRRVAIVTNAGGPGILAADACVAGGLDVQPTAAGIANPVDLIASADGARVPSTHRDAACSRRRRCRARDLHDDRQRAHRRNARGDHEGRCRRAARRLHRQAGRRLHDGIAEHGAAPCGHGDRCRSTSSRNRRHARSRKPQRTRSGGGVRLGRSCRSATCALREARDLCRDIARARGESWLTPQELQQLLHAADLQLAPSVLAHSADEAAALARVFGYPVVAKLVSPQSGAQDRSRRRAAASWQRARSAHGVRRAVRHAAADARRIARGHSHSADGDERQPKRLSASRRIRCSGRSSRSDLVALRSSSSGTWRFASRRSPIVTPTR